MSAIDSSDTTTVILGSGIIGLSTAYYLSESGHTDPKSIHLVEANSALFHCASGLAGGFLAQDCMFASFHQLSTLPYLKCVQTNLAI
jgi:glycine/D-amino acid oxidase-like deaminating enzyme